MPSNLGTEIENGLVTCTGEAEVEETSGNAKASDGANLAFFSTFARSVSWIILPTCTVLFRRQAPICHIPSSYGIQIYFAPCSVSLASLILPFSCFLTVLWTNNSRALKAGSCDCGEGDFQENSKTAYRRYRLKPALPNPTAHYFEVAQDYQETDYRDCIRCELDEPNDHIVRRLMEFDNDPFPFLPKFDEPQIFDANMTDAMEEGALEFPELRFDSPGLWNTSVGASPVLSKSDGSQAIKPPFIDPAFSQSPESSSASDSSNNQHKRNHSSDSSRSGALAGDGDVSMNGILIGADMEDRASDKSSPATDVDLSNRAMECHFDFDSAASSPSPFAEPKPAFKPSSVRSIKMPYRSSPNAGFTHGFGPYPAVSKVSHC